MENFSKVIKRAMIACENSGHNIGCDFPEVRKIVKAGATKKPVLDYELTRYTCYMGLYGGLDVDDIHARKGLEVGQKILDYMGSTELIANLFRISQTEEKLRKDEVVKSQIHDKKDCYGEQRFRVFFFYKKLPRNSL